MACKRWSVAEAKGAAREFKLRAEKDGGFPDDPLGSLLSIIVVLHDALVEQEMATAAFKFAATERHNSRRSKHERNNPIRTRSRESK